MEVQGRADAGYVYFCNDRYLYRLYETQKKAYLLFYFQSILSLRFLVNLCHQFFLQGNHFVTAKKDADGRKKTTTSIIIFIIISSSSSFNILKSFHVLLSFVSF